MLRVVAHHSQLTKTDNLGGADIGLSRCDVRGSMNDMLRFIGSSIPNNAHISTNTKTPTFLNPEWGGPMPAQAKRPGFRRYATKQNPKGVALIHEERHRAVALQTKSGVVPQHHTRTPQNVRLIHRCEMFSPLKKEKIPRLRVGLTNDSGQGFSEVKGT